VVVESQPVPGGPFVIRAHHRRDLPGKEGQARLVQGAEVPPWEEVVTAVFRVQHGAGAMIFATLRGVMTRDQNRVGLSQYVPGPELLIVVDLASRVRFAARVIEALDVQGPQRELRTFTLRHAPATEVAAGLNGLLGVLAGGGQPGLGPQQGQGLGAPYVHPDTRGNQLLVAAFAQDLPTIERIVADLDRRVEPPSGLLHVYRCRHADAVDLVKTVDGLLQGKAGAAAPGGTGPPANVGGVTTRVVADEPTNSLLVEAEEARWLDVLQILEELDAPRRRVVIEVEVYEVSTPSDQLTFGVELTGVSQGAEDKTRASGLTSFGLSQVQLRPGSDGSPTQVGRVPGISAGLTALIARDAFDKIPVLISALASTSKARLVTRSLAATNDGKSASFGITSSQPVLTVGSTQVIATQEVTYVDASSILTIEPVVNSEEELTLSLTLKIAAFSGAGSPQLPPPRTSRDYQGVVTVPNGRYVVFGGLESESETLDEQKVPFLGDVPVLGYLFKSMRRTRTQTKVYIFVRPRILSDLRGYEDARASEALRERIVVQASRDGWLPPLLADPGPAGWDLRDEAMEVFGTGSGDPFHR
jgi:general secretion pathway protein D